MRSQLIKIFADDIKNVLSLVLAKSGNNLLDHMFALVVLGETADVIILQKVLLDQFEFFFLCNGFNDGLKSPRTFFVTWNIKEILSFNLFQEVDSLSRIEILNQFFIEVVTVVVCH